MSEKTNALNAYVTGIGSNAQNCSLGYNIKSIIMMNKFCLSWHMKWPIMLKNIFTLVLLHHCYLFHFRLVYRRKNNELVYERFGTLENSSM